MEFIKEGKFKYIESIGGKDVLLLLHGLFGGLSNFESIIERFGNKYNVVMPLLPILELPTREVTLENLVNFVEDFIEFKSFNKVNVLGNSLGGHIAQLLAFQRPEIIHSLVLTGSSGLFENSMGSTFPKRGNYEFIKTKTESTFYDPSVASKELVDEVFDIVNDRMKAIKIVATAKSAIRHNVENKLDKLKAPTLLIWGKQDTITPPFVGEKFHALLSNSELHFIDKCGHAAMMEKPNEFSTILENFLVKVCT